MTACEAPRESPRGKLIASYACATLVLLLGLATLVHARVLDHTASETNRSRLVARRALETEVLLLDAEAGQRAYLLTHDEHDLEPALRAAADVKTHLAGLAELVADAPEERALAEQLADSAARAFAEMDRIRSLAPGCDEPALAERVIEERRPLDEVRAAVTSLLAASQIARERSEQSSLAFRTVVPWFLGTGEIIAFALAVAVTSWIAQWIRRLRAANVELGVRAEKLLAQAEALAQKEEIVEAQLAEQRFLTSRLAASNEALRISNTDLEQFAYVASHDLRAPLRGIANVSEWLEDDLGAALTPPIKRHIGALRGRVRRLEALIAGIAEYSRAGRTAEAQEAVDVGRLVKQCVDLIAPPRTVRVEAATPMPTILTTRTPLQQIFLNLLSNAIKHGAAKGGLIEVRAEEEPDRWRFSVSDRGPGIAPEYHEKIFALFQTLAPRDKVEGTGIGLAVVKKLIDRYGGSIRVDSTPGAGATFTFTWPKNIRG